MAITPKQTIGTAVGIGRGAVNLFRRDDASEPAPDAKPSSRTSGPPETVGAPKPGEPRGVKSATAPRKKAPTSKSGEV